VEIGDYLRVIRRRLWILILVPVLAAGAVGAMLWLRPAEYRAVATVAAPALVGGSAENQYSGSGGARVFVANFAAALTAPQVLATVAEQTGTSEQNIQDDISAVPIQESSLIEVTYSDTDRARTGTVARAASRETIKFLFQSQVDLARRSLNTADKGVADAKKKLADFIQKNRIVNPEQTYELQEQNLIALQQRQLEAQAEGSTTIASRLGEAIQARQAELARLAPLVTSYRDLVAQQDGAETRRNDLQRNLEGLLAQSRAADPDSVVTVSDPEQVSRLMAFVRQGGVAFAAGLFLAIAIVFLLELLRRPAAAEASAVEVQVDRFPVVGHLPYSDAVASGSSNVLADLPLAQAGENLLTEVAARLGGRVRGVIVITSPPGSHGKTVVSTVLATLLGHTNNHVLLVGTHLSYPSASRSGNGDGRGMVPSRWSFSEDAPHSWVTSLWALERGLWVLPAWPDEKGGRLPPMRLGEIVHEARDLFDVVIVDTPGHLDAQGLEIITWIADGVLEVVSNADGAASMRRSVQAHLQRISAPFIGLVINRVKGRPALVDSLTQDQPVRPDPHQ
jgi:capsular polysaccharide biosynthesis protein/MinD-like ATPase involved in chromosome partitioning or flagellar assembly